MRKSNFELLRIVAMLMVTAHHLVLHNATGVWSMEFGPARLFISVFMLGMGKAGVLVFFGITAWFLCDRGVTYRSVLRKIWVMERELLFYSLGLYAASRAFLPGLAQDGLGWQSVTPLLMNLWWYPTTYAVFLLVVPALLRGLRSLGREGHGSLVVVVFLAWGLLQGLRPINVPTNDDIVVFCALFTVISYYRWYMKPLSARAGAAMVLAGVLAIAYGFVWYYLDDPTNAGMQGYLSDEWKLPAVLVALGLLVGFSHLSFSSKWVNCVAASSFAVYLISEYPTIRTLLWKVAFDMGPVYVTPFAVPIACAVVAGVFLALVTIDAVRRALFSLLLPRTGALFDRLWEAAGPVRNRVSEEMRSLCK